MADNFAADCQTQSGALALLRQRIAVFHLMELFKDLGQVLGGNPAARVANRDQQVLLLL